MRTHALRPRPFIRATQFSDDLAIWAYGLGTGIIIGAIATMLLVTYYS